MSRLFRRRSRTSEDTANAEVLSAALHIVVGLLSTTDDWGDHSPAKIRHWAIQEAQRSLQEQQDRGV